MKNLLLLAAFAGVAIGLFWPRTGATFPDCIVEQGSHVWIGTPTDDEVLSKFQVTYPGVEVSGNAMIVKEKVLEEITPCNFINFNGHQNLHRVRIRCEVYYSDKMSNYLPVYFEYDHYHMNGGGCEWKNAR
jgi:hypothetical protein